MDQSEKIPKLGGFLKFFGNSHRVVELFVTPSAAHPRPETLLCRVPRSSFAWAGVFTCHSNVSPSRVRQSYGLCVYGYVVMPEHVHLLVNEPERGHLAQMLQSLKQSVARTLALRAADSFWQARYYDFNVWSERKFVEKLRYIHRNPVIRGLVGRPEDWRWSSFRHYLTGAAGVVENESQWTARRRERLGIVPTVRIRSDQ